MDTINLNITSMFRIYRYVSLIWCSIIYIIGVQYQSMWQKIIIIGGLTLAAVCMDYLYRYKEKNKNQTILMIIIEVICNSVVLMLSGGIESPYVWYTINTLFIVGEKIGSIYIWTNSMVYLSVMIEASRQIAGRRISLLEEFNIITAVILLSLAITIIYEYAKKVEERRAKAEEYLDYTLRIYEAVYVLTSTKDYTSLVDVLLNYMLSVMKSSKSFVGLYYEEEIYARSINMSVEEENYLKEQIYYNVDNTDEYIKEIKAYSYGLIGIRLEYAYDYYGMMFVQGKENKEELDFLGYISNLVVKKFSIEELNKELLLNEEQNRIANEIHDSILQKLFGLSCKVFMIAKKVSDREIAAELNNVREELTRSMTELRSTIYGLSWNKGGSDEFIRRIKSYIGFIEQCYGARIVLVKEGDFGILTIEQKTVLYRVVCEAISNAARHGKAKTIDIHLSIYHHCIELNIEDRGQGFDYEEVIGTERQGLGIRNMTQIVEQLGGEIKIQSALEVGTQIRVCIPTERIKEGVC